MLLKVRGKGVGVQVAPRGVERVVSMRCIASIATSPMEVEIKPGLFEGFWSWKGHRIRYQKSGATNDGGGAVLLVHGFGGNCDHWRQNTPALGEAGLRAFSIDLLGYGYSDKPDPRSAPTNSVYNFETWGRQLACFVEEQIQEPAVIVCNSVGGLAGLEAAIQSPDQVLGVQLLDISLRNLHVRRMSPLARPWVAAFQRLLRETQLGQAFFANVATTKTVRTVLQQAYGRPEAVTDELVDAILRPGLQPGAVEVFLDFISYSGGPLPEDLLRSCPRPVSILWGEADPWEPIEQGRRLFQGISCIEEFVALPGVGHCPMDESPDVVNPLIQRFVASLVARQAAATPDLLVLPGSL